MKIPITRTVLQGMPGTAWGMLYRFLMDRENDAAFTSVQRTAAYGMRYFYGMQDEGHRDFLADDAAPDKEALAWALRDMGARAFAENLLQNDPARADEWFGENERSLMEALQAYRRRHTDAFYEIVEEDYNVTLPGGIFWIGAVEAALMFALMIYFAITTPQDGLLICITFSALASLGLALMAAVKYWRIAVRGDTLTHRSPFRRRRTLRVDEITGVTEKPQGLIIFAHGKRFVSVDRFDAGYTMLWVQMKVAGKTAKEPPDRFTIRQTKSNILVGLLAPCAVLFTLWRTYQPPSPAVASLRVVLLAALVGSLYLAVYYLWWAVTVSEDVLIVRRALRGEKEIPIADIDKAVVDDQYMTLYAQGKKAVRIPIRSEGYADLAGRLRERQAQAAPRGAKG